MAKRKPEMSWDIDDVTLEDVAAEIDRTIARLHKLQILYGALQEEDHKRIAKLIEEFRAAQREVDEHKDRVADGVGERDPLPSSDTGRDQRPDQGNATAG